MVSRVRRPLVFLSIVLFALPGPLFGGSTDEDSAAVDFFEKKVRPLLVQNCYSCHSADTNAKGGLRVDDRNGLIEGGQSGPAVFPGDPEASLLIQAVKKIDGGVKMPPKKKLSEDEIGVLTKWIETGAVWSKTAPTAGFKTNERYQRLKKDHWAWQPLHSTQPPDVRDSSWPSGDVDRFLRAKQEEAGLAPVGEADRLTLIRRVAFDLTGLPPTTNEIDEYLSDQSEKAFEKVVDKFLASRAFGERWGRHWLDVARYGESTGSSRNIPFPHAWRYRDYVIDSFTNDKPYDQFIREQVAGDLLPATSQAERDEHAVATGFLALGVKDVNQRFKVRFVMDNVDEQIDAVSRSVLALTVSCARCHDHKFDPIPTADYYALAGVFRSTDLCAGVRNKMGGSGLDYYDTNMLVRLGLKTEPDTRAEQNIQEAKLAYEKAKKEFEEIRGTPQGLARDEKGQPKQAPFDSKC